MPIARHALIAILVSGIFTLTHAGAVQQADRRLPGTASGQAGSERRLALVVGNSAYPEVPLKNPVNDARAVGATLREVGFDVTEAFDLRRSQFERAVDAFVFRLRTGDVALFYYAGHGFQIEGENYFVPVDFSAVDVADAKYEAYAASRVHEKIADRGVRLVLIVLDACRGNPFRATRSAAGGGWAAMGAGRGSYIVFATAPGQTASDNPAAANGLFTQHLVDALREPGLGLDAVFNRVRAAVARASGDRQVPWTTSSVVGEFVFRPGRAGARS